MYRIFTTKEFDDDFESLDRSEKVRIKKILNQLKERGPDVGKPLSGLSSLEKNTLMVRDCTS